MFENYELFDVEEEIECFDDLEALRMSTTSHFDEQCLFDYLNATDEDGNWLHPYSLEVN